MAVDYQEGIKKQWEQMWTFLEIFICGKKMFSAR